MKKCPKCGNDWMSPEGYTHSDYKYWHCKKCNLKLNVIGTDYLKEEDFIKLR